MRSKLLSLSSALLLFSISGASAQGVLKEGFNTDAFPEVSFVWHEDNPERLSNSDFKGLTEAGLPCEFTVEHLPVKVDPDEKQYVVFLWEDLAYHGANLYGFSKESLRGFFESWNFRSKDEVNVSVYGRRDVSDASYLKDLTGGFVSDDQTLLAAIDNYPRSTRRISSYPNRADIFPAVSEALEILHKCGEGSKAVVVLTAGYPLDNSSASSDMNARLLAEKYHIPVYFLQYGRDHGYSAKLSSFAPLTHGTFNCFADIDQDTNIEAAADVIHDIYKTLPTRYYGNDYKITYTSKTSRGDDAVLLQFKVNGFDYKEQMVPPAWSLSVFLKENILLVCLCLFVVLCLIALWIVLSVTRRRRNKRALAALSLETQQNREAAMNAISDARESFDRRFDQADIDRRNEKAAERAAEIEEQLNRRSIYPRLIYQIDGNAVSYVVSKVQTTIGREASNDLVISDSRVSRRHAMIVFNGFDFDVKDEGSMNGVIVNGTRISAPVTLRNGDKLEIGGVHITVYI